jgi:hypothetical protein
MKFLLFKIFGFIAVVGILVSFRPSFAYSELYDLTIIIVPKGEEEVTIPSRLSKPTIAYSVSLDSDSQIYKTSKINIFTEIFNAIITKNMISKESILSLEQIPNSDSGVFVYSSQSGKMKRKLVQLVKDGLIRNEYKMKLPFYAIGFEKIINGCETFVYMFYSEPKELKGEGFGYLSISGELKFLSIAVLSPKSNLACGPDVPLNFARKLKIDIEEMYSEKIKRLRK